MKKIKLSKKDIYDLASVVSVIVKEESKDLDFKEVIQLQKTVNDFVSCVQDFSDKIEKIEKEKQSLVEASNNKISEYKKKLQEKSDKKSEIDEKYKEKLDAFVQDILTEANTQIANEIVPQIEALYKGLGSDVMAVEIEEEKYKMLVINFEKYAKERYNNKSKMVEVYEALMA